MVVIGTALQAGCSDTAALTRRVCRAKSRKILAQLLINSLCVRLNRPNDVSTRTAAAREAKQVLVTAVVHK